LFVFNLSNGAHDQDRTDDLVLTKDVLYQLSYMGTNKMVALTILIPSNDKKPQPSTAFLLKLGLGLTISRDLRPNDGGQNRNARAQLQCVLKTFFDAFWPATSPNRLCLWKML
jgi:hypothetical protein